MSPLTQKIIGFFSLISALLWIILSAGTVFVGISTIDSYDQSIQAEYRKIDAGLGEIQSATEWLPDGWTEPLRNIDKGLFSIFTSISESLALVKLVLIVLPILMILSQITPLFIGVDLLKQ